MLVKDELNRLGLHYTKVHLGEVNVMENLTIEQYDQLKNALLKSGLQLMDNKKAILIEKMKNIIIDITHCGNEPYPSNFSDYISNKLNYDYTYLANLFSDVMGITIEHYVIAHKIERVKELILYDELNLTEISYLLNYSSVAHLSSQFKKVTGLTPTFFKQLKNRKISTIENV